MGFSVVLGLLCFFLLRVFDFRELVGFVEHLNTHQASQ